MEAMKAKLKLILVGSGFKLLLKPGLNYEISLHARDKPFPFFSPGAVKLFGSQNKSIEISMAQKEITLLESKGFLQYKKHQCKDESGTILWQERIDNFVRAELWNISCIPFRSINIFNSRNLPQCNLSEEVTIIKKLSDFSTQFELYCNVSTKCLPTCSEINLIYKTESVKYNDR
jgi:hypothetical protein